LHSQISSTGSGKISTTVVIYINNFLHIFLGENFYITNFALRKAAHFSEYFILGILFHKCFSKPDNWTYSFFYPVIAGILYAISDEVHQYFVPGRAMSIVDMLIDTAGVLLAVIVFKFINDRRNNL
jgi:VanZ family protein